MEAEVKFPRPAGLDVCGARRKTALRKAIGLIVLAFSCYGAQPDKTIVVLGARAGDAERLGGQSVVEYRARGYQIVNSALVGSGLDLGVDITVATRRPRAQAQVAQFILTHNPEITITHCIGEGSVVNHGAADLVYRAWQDARHKGARVGQLWFRIPNDHVGMISEPSFRRFFERTRRGDYFVVADAQSPAAEASQFVTGPPPAYRPPAGRQPIVMAIGAHADDVEWGFGGTLAKLIEQGWKGIYVVAINNTAGNHLDSVHEQPKPEDYLNIQKVIGPYPVDALESIQIRQEESRRAAAVYGAQPEFLNLHETFFWLGRQEVYFYDPRWALFDPPGTGIVTSAAAGSQGLDLATELIKRYQPDVVLAMLLADRNPEHGETGDIAYRAFVRAAREGAHVGQLWMSMRDRPQYLERVRMDPDISVDVTSQLPRYLAALEEHVSQGQQRAGNQVRLDRFRMDGHYYEHFVLVMDGRSSSR